MTSHQTLVLFLREKESWNKNTWFTRSEVYVFYDYQTKLFGIRGKMYNKNNYVSHPNIFSWDCSCTLPVLDFLKEVHQEYEFLTVSTVNYTNLPSFSENITFEYLSSNYSRQSEVSGMDYEKKQFDLDKLITHLNIMENIYTEY